MKAKVTDISVNISCYRNQKTKMRNGKELKVTRSVVLGISCLTVVMTILPTHRHITFLIVSVLV